MSWSVTRNVSLGSSNQWQPFFYHFKEALVAAGWEMVAYGTGWGAGTTYTKTPPIVDPWGSAGDVNETAWFVMTNGDGVQLYSRAEDGMAEFGWSVDGDYLAESPGPWDDANESTRPGHVNPPTDEINFIDVEMSLHYVSFATTANSFIAFGRIGWDDTFALALVEVGAKTGDGYPYWGYGRSGSDGWEVGGLSNTGSGIYYPRSYHPTLGSINYPLMNMIVASSTDLFGSVYDLAEDTITGNMPKLSSMCVCNTWSGGTSYVHYKGVVPGIYRVPNSVALGDRVVYGTDDLDIYMCLGDYVVPWDSETDELEPVP